MKSLIIILFLLLGTRAFAQGVLLVPPSVMTANSMPGLNNALAGAQAIVPKSGRAAVRERRTGVVGFSR
jgi:hypothetical protein